MPNLPISTLPAAAALAGTEPLPTVQGGVTVRTTAQDVADLAPPLDIGALPAAAALTGAEPLAVDQGGTTVQTTAQDVADLAPPLDIGALPAAAALTGAEPLAVEQGGITVQTTAQDVADLAGAATPTSETHAIFRSGTWYCAIHSTVANVNASADLFVATPIYFGRPVSLDDIAVVVTAGVGGTSVLAGLYDDNDGRPDNLVAQCTGALSTAASVVVTGSFAAPYVTSAGLYWLALLFSGAPGIRGWPANGDNSLASIIGAPGLYAISNGAAWAGFSGVATFAGGLPASFGAVTDFVGTIPAGLIKVA